MSKPIYRFNSYKDFINELVKSSPNAGRGLFRKMALHLNLSSVTMSQVFRGTRDLSMEQTLQVAQFWNLDNLQTKYFLLMLQKEKSSHYQFTEFCLSQMSILQREMEEIHTRVPKSKHISEKARSIFYSHWKFSATRLLTDIEGKNNLAAISKELRLPIQEVKQVLEFLINNSLIIEDENKSHFKIGPQTTHLESHSPWLRQHHLNWRAKALEGLGSLSKNELSYTAPMAVSESSLYEIREILLETIEKIIPIIKNSKSETLACFNIDLFKVNK